MTLTEFLLARIAEDEAVAERAGSHNGRGTFAKDNYGCLLVQPDRVLAECKANRRIVELHVPDDGEPQECSLCNVMIDTCCGDAEFELWPCRTLVALALPYADRPGYDPAWRL